LYRREQNGDDGGAHPGIEEELRTEPSEQVGNASRQPYNFPHIRVVEEEQLKLLLKMQMMRIGQSEKEEDSHTEQERATCQILY
jgi:hypothetical protein